MRKGATIADIETLKKYDINAIINLPSLSLTTESTSETEKTITSNISTLSTVSTSLSSQSITYKGWTFYSLHGPILDSNQRDTIANNIANELNNNNNEKNISIIANDDKITIKESILRLPSAIFDDYFSISSQSFNIDISFRAQDALLCWANQHINTNVEVLQVPYASKWKEKQNFESGTEEFICNEMRKWDWTFSTDYDYTFEKNKNESTLFSFIPQLGDSKKYPINVKELSKSIDNESSSSSSAWIKTDTSGIDIAMLSQTNVPILFYDEIILYQDDLDDCGESTLEIKIRVMPECWFVLKRLFIRVDDVKVRIRDCRIFHKFGESLIHMEITWKESSLPLPSHIQSSLIRVASQSSSLPMHAINSSHSLPPSMLLKSGPLAQYLPSIMENEKLHPYYSIVI